MEPARPPRPPTLSRALFAPRYVLSTLEVATTFAVLVTVFGVGRGFPVVVAASLLPFFLVLVTQYMLEQRRQVKPIEALAAKAAAGGLDETDRFRLGEALVLFPRRVVYVRFMAWAGTAAVLVAAFSAHPELHWYDLGAVVGVCFVSALVFLMLRALWFRHAAESALLPILRDADAHRYLGRTLRERVFLAAYLPGTVAAVLAGLYDLFYLELDAERVRSIFVTVPAISLVLTLNFARYLVRATAPVRGHLAGRPLAGEHDGPWKLVGPHEDPGPREALQVATTLPWRAAKWTLVLWGIAGVVIGAEHVAIWAPWQEGVLLFAGFTAVGLAAALVQLGWTRRVVQPARELCARELGTVPLDELRPRVRVRDRFVATVVVVLVGSSTFAFSTLYLQQRALLAAAAGAQARLALDDLWPRLEPLASLGPDARLAEVLRLAPELPDALVLLERGRVVWSSQPLDVLSEPARELAEGRPEVALRRSRLTLAVRPLGDGGAFALARPWPRFLGAYGATGLSLLFAALWVLAVAIALIAAADFTAPIGALRGFARRLGRGELEAPLPVPDNDEVGELGLALDRMRADLRRQIEAVRELNQSLERKVAERTAELEHTLGELHATQAQVVHSEKMASVGRLAAGVAHEINNPLNFIANSLGPLEHAMGELRAAALRGGGSDAKLQESVEEVGELLRLIRTGVQRTQQIVRGLRDFSRRDEGEPLRETDLAATFDQTLALLRHELSGLEVVRAYADDSRATCYPGAMAQLLMNLVANAAQAMNGRGTLTVATHRRAGALELVVKDTGSGISPEVLPKIFDPFFTTKDVGRGTGLGLSIAHGIVERHGARMSVDSRVGEGTEFRVVLPLPKEGLARAS